MRVYNYKGFLILILVLSSIKKNCCGGGGGGGGGGAGGVIQALPITYKAFVKMIMNLKNPSHQSLVHKMMRTQLIPHSLIQHFWV